MESLSIAAVQLRHKRFHQRRLFSFGGPPTTDDGNDDGGLTDDDDGADSPTTDDGNESGDNALNQLLSSQEAQIQATATSVFSSTETAGPGGLVVPTSSSLSSDSSSSSSVSSLSSSSSSSSSSTTPTSTLSQTSTTTSTDITTPTSASSAAAITALPSLTAQSTAPASSSAALSSHKSSHAAAIGVTVALFLLVAIAAGFHIIRKKMIARRNARRTTWNPPVFNRSDSSGSEEENGVAGQFETIDINEKHGPSTLPQHVTYQTMSNISYGMPAPPPPLHPTGYAPPRMPSPPPISNSVDQSRAGPSPVATSSPSFAGGPTHLVSSTQFAPLTAPQSTMVSRNSAGSVAQRAGGGGKGPIAVGTLVVVARTFVPSLPDELSIQTGEQVRLISRYDDGWAHVERMRSGAGIESGVVPMECLESLSAPATNPNIPYGNMSGMGLAQQAVEGWRLSKRGSSLHYVENAQY